MSRHNHDYIIQKEAHALLESMKNDFAKRSTHNWLSAFGLYLSREHDMTAEEIKEVYLYLESLLSSTLYLPDVLEDEVGIIFDDTKNKEEM